MTRPDRVDPVDPLDLADAAQRVAGALAARGRGDSDGARSLLCSFDDQADLVAGAMLVAQLSLGLLSRATDTTIEECVADLCLGLGGVDRREGPAGAPPASAGG